MIVYEPESVFQERKMGFSCVHTHDQVNDPSKSSIYACIYSFYTSCSANVLPLIAG